MATTWDILSAGVVASNGGLTVENTTTSWLAAWSSDKRTVGKWYWEVNFDAVGTMGDYNRIGVDRVSTGTLFPGNTTSSWGYSGDNGLRWNANSSSAYGDPFTVGDVIGVALDLNDGKIYFSKNGVWQNSGDPVAGTNPAYTGLVGPMGPAVGMFETPTRNTGVFDAASLTYAPPLGYLAYDTPPGLVAKSIVVDVTNNHQVTQTSLRIRSIECKRNGVVVGVGTTVGFTVWGNDSTVIDAFVVSRSKTGAHAGNGWQWDTSGPVRIVCVLNTPQEIDELVINNHHDFGADTEFGVKDVIITTSLDAIENTTYLGPITNGTVLFNGEVAQHVASDVVDDQVVYTFEEPVLITGIITDEAGYKVARIVRAYNRLTGELIQSTTSSPGTGEYGLVVPASAGEVQRIVLDDAEGETVLNDLIDRILLT